MGIYRLIRYNPTQTTINPTTIFSRGIFSFRASLRAFRCPILRPLNGVRLGVPGGCGMCIQGFADFLRESKECKRFMQERGSLLDTLAGLSGSIIKSGRSGKRPAMPRWMVFIASHPLRPAKESDVSGNGTYASLPAL
jgi:hypothetical protein